MEPQSFETYAKVKLELLPQVGVETKSVKPPPILRYLAILIFIITALAFQTATPCQDFQKASHKIKNGLTFHFTSWFRGILILVYDNPHITGQYSIYIYLCTLNSQVFFNAQVENMASVSIDVWRIGYLHSAAPF